MTFVADVKHPNAPGWTDVPAQYLRNSNAVHGQAVSGRTVAGPVH